MDHKFKNVLHYDNSPFIIIYNHGLNPYGVKYLKENTTELIKYCKLKKYSFASWIRPINETYNFKEEYKYFLKEFKKEFHDFNSKLIIIGHSFGAVFSLYFSSQLKCVGISLDGSNLYDTYDYYISEYLGHEIDPNKIKYSYGKIIYDGVNYWDKPEARTNHKYSKCLWDVYKFLHDKYYLIDYYGTPDGKIKIEKIKNKHYPNYFNLYYTKNYYHSLHKYKTVIETIFNLILNNYEIKGGTKKFNYKFLFIILILVLIYFCYK